MALTDADGDVTDTYTYDAWGNQDTYDPSLPSGYTVEYGYNAAGQKTEVLVKYSSTDDYKTTYSYFKNEWLKQVKGWKYESGQSRWEEPASAFRSGFPMTDLCFGVLPDPVVVPAALRLQRLRASV